MKKIEVVAASMPDVKLNAVAGDVFRMEDLLYALMLESDNDVMLVPPSIIFFLLKLHIV